MPQVHCSRSPYSALHLFLDEHHLKCVQKHTINHRKINDSDFNLHLDELESFIGLELALGVLVGKNTPIKQLWSKNWVQPILRNTVSRDRYTKIMKHLQFDDFQQRRQRRETDKFCLISEVWNSFIENCKKYCVPNNFLSIDEQLFPCKTKCPFIQYMANKPDKFGIKFWLLADAQTKYLCNGKPYLGKDPTRSRCTDLPGDVCLNLLQSCFGKGYNLTTDNYFTSLKLADELMTKKTTILETTRKQRREVLNMESLMKDKLLHDSEIFSPSDCCLTVYKAKKKKIVCILSSTHKHVKVDESHKKKLPKTVQYYYKSKKGVDVLDQMAIYHTCKDSSR